MTVFPTRLAGPLLAACLLAACGNTTPATPPPSVAVTTIKPQQQSFTDTVAALGSVTGDPSRIRQLSLAQGGEVVALMAASGQSVHAGQALLKVAMTPAARKAYKQAQNALTLARDQWSQTRHLATRHLATQAQVDAARKAVDDAEAALQAQRQLGGAHAIETVTAPSNGVVTSLLVAQGQRVAANATLATFVPTDALLAQLGVDPAQADRIKVGMPVTLHAVYGTTGDATGKVRMVGHHIDPATHQVSVQVTLPAAWAARIVAGTALSARIRIDRYTAWAVPRQSLRRDANGAFVFQVDKGKAKRVDVTVRSPEGTTVGVTGQLDANLPVIVAGSYEAANGIPVRQPKAGMAPSHRVSSR
ncbi:MAG TPA: efflux RND transporter periplasmic adaptor subunit [Rhodanobacteraceae bacterium]